MGAKADRLDALERDVDTLERRITNLTNDTEQLRRRIAAVEAKVSRPGIREQVTAPARRFLDDITKAVGL